MKKEQGRRSKVLLVANLLMLFMLLGTAVYAFVWNNTTTEIDIGVGADDTLIIITEDINNQNEGLKLIPQNATKTHGYEKKELEYTVEITLESDLERDDLDKDDLKAYVINEEDHLDVNVKITKKVDNVWTVTITVKLDGSIDNSAIFKEKIEGKTHKITINFTLTTIPIEE